MSLNKISKISVDECLYMERACSYQWKIIQTENTMNFGMVQNQQANLSLSQLIFHDLLRIMASKDPVIFWSYRNAC